MALAQLWIGGRVWGTPPALRLRAIGVGDLLCGGPGDSLGWGEHDAGC